jgi:hypothetical protein
MPPEETSRQPAELETGHTSAPGPSFGYLRGLDNQPKLSSPGLLWLYTKPAIAFELAGTSDGDLARQLGGFRDALGRASQAPGPLATPRLLR